ncbi:hypothetical protein CYY_006754 [Polysphondylium violaceum]|uniref:Armadillo repeat-containing protein n=1 Tax=Polysphondylium violaceum TaxID=133409 RepID=A0A8J4V5I0_9MYCE|nr:hypothetical protein CYY_006754 [Polysphondylium violaceum]
MEQIEQIVNSICSDKDQNSHVYNKEDVEKLTKEIILSKEMSDQQVNVNAFIFKTLADWGRVEGNRVVIPESSNIFSIIETVLNNLYPTPTSNINDRDVYCLEMIARLLGNLTFELEDARKDIFVNHKSIILHCIEFLKQSKFNNLKKNTFATLANFSSDTDYMQVELYNLGIIPLLMENITKDNPVVQVWAIKCFNNIVDSKITQTNIHFKDVQKLYIELKKTLKEEGWIDNDFADDIVTALSKLALNKDLEKETLEQGFLNDLLDLVENTEDQRNMVDDMDDEEEIDKDQDLSVGPITSELIKKISDNDEHRHFFSKNNIIQRMISIITKQPPVYQEVSKKNSLKLADYSKTVRNITKALAYCSLDDDIIEQMIKTPQVFIDLVKSDSTENVTDAEMIIGNLAISAQNCKALNELNVIDTISDVMKRFPNFQPIQHYGLSAIKNLTIPSINKDYVPSQALLEDVVFNMKVHNQVIQFASITLIKNFISCQSNYKILEQGQVIQPLINLAQGKVPASMDEEDEPKITEEGQEPQEEKKKEKDKRVIYESTRLLLRFVENANLLESDETKELVRRESVEPFFDLLLSPHPVLQNEGALGLSILVKIDNNYIVSKPNWLATFISCLKVSFVPFQQFIRESDPSVNKSDPQHQKLFQIIQQNLIFSNDLQNHLFNIIYQFSLVESIGKYMKDNNIIQELKDMKNRQEASPNVKTIIQKILVQLTI